jgi:glucosamine--fructose-6-phosphate aminotransferase (isomerizing)
MKKLGAIMESEIAETPAVYQRLFADQKQFVELKNLLSERKIHTILILARGTSDNAAFFLKYLIETQLGLPVGLTSPSAVSVYGAELKVEGTLVIAISQSGQSPDLVQFAQAAKAGGATLLTMLNAPESPLEAIADYKIQLMGGAEIAVAATKSYSAQLLSSLILVSQWAGKSTSEADLLTEAERLLAQADLYQAIAQQINLSKQVVILGRGFSFPNAKEAALKLQETCKVAVQSWSIADYLHGPISALKPDSQVIILAPAHMPQGPLLEAVTKIRPITDRIIWLGEGGLVASTDLVIPGARCIDEIRSSVVDAISLQLLTLAMSLQAGLDPDSPAGLSKVTLTH